MHHRLLTFDQSPEYKTGYKPSLERWMNQLSSASSLRKCKEAGVISGQEACDYFSACIAHLEELIAPQVHHYSTLRWLFYLRRLPHSVFAGRLGSTGPNRRALAESYCSKSEGLCEAYIDANGAYQFRVDDSTLRHLVRLLALVDLINEFQVYYRYAGKNLSFKFHQKWPWNALPRVIQDASIQAAIRAYDDRHDVQVDPMTHLLSKAGTGHELNKTKSDHVRRMWFLSDERELKVSELISEKDYPEFFKAAGNGTHIRVGFTPTALDLESAFKLFRDQAYAEEKISENAITSLIVMMLSEKALSRKPLATLTTASTGYFIIPLEEMTGIGAQYYKDILAEIRANYPQLNAPESFEDFLKLAEGIRANSWPISLGAPIKAARDYLCLDVWSASMSFIAGFNIPKRQGEVANVRALDFEDAVQKAIQATPWRASPELLKSRRVPLKRGGKQITDIDAIATDGESLLLVSCKSIPYTPSYDKGDYRDVRNANSTVTEAVKYWRSIVDFFSENRTGDNWNFEGFKKIMGVVCTPFVVYTTDELALSNVAPGLYTASSLEELLEWLRKP